MQEIWGELLKKEWKSYNRNLGAGNLNQSWGKNERFEAIEERAMILKLKMKKIIKNRNLKDDNSEIINEDFTSTKLYSIFAPKIPSKIPQSRHLVKQYQTILNLHVQLKPKTTPKKKYSNYKKKTYRSKIVRGRKTSSKQRKTRKTLSFGENSPIVLSSSTRYVLWSACVAKTKRENRDERREDSGVSRGSRGPTQPVRGVAYTGGSSAATGAT